MILRLIRPGRATTILRRSLTVPSILIATAIGVVGAPLWLLIAGLLDAARDGFRGRFVRIRLVTFGLGYLSCETAGIAVAFLLWIARLVLRPSVDRYRQWNFRLQCLWGDSLLRIAQLAFGFRFEVEGADCVAPGPILLLLRHSSLADTVLAVSQVSRPHDLLLRYVLKRPLLLDPCIDIVGQRLINLFVLKGARRASDQIRDVGALAEGLGRDQGVLIYPEGTRFTQAKKAALLDKLARRNAHDELEFARSLEHVLPPIRGGTLALLETSSRQSPPADVVFCAHQGFEGSATVRDLLAGRLIDRTVRISFWRVPAAEIPAEGPARLRWLCDQWLRMDREVERLRTARSQP